MTTPGNCSLCNKSLVTKDKQDVTTGTCLHSFHRKCIEKRIADKKSTDCPKCDKPIILKNKTPSNYRGGDDDDDDDDNDYKPQSKLSRWNQAENNEWECDECGYVNKNSDPVCQNCRHSKQQESGGRFSSPPKIPSASTKHYSPPSPSVTPKKPVKGYPADDDDDDDDDDRNYRKSSASKPYHRDDDDDDVRYNPGKKHSASSEHKTDSAKISKPTPQCSVPMYVADLPLYIHDDDDLANHLSRRIKQSCNVEVSKVRCYAKLGVGIIHVESNKVKDRLIEDIGKLSWTAADSHAITFKDSIEIRSFIVIEEPSSKSDPDLPTDDEIKRRWMEMHNNERPKLCQQLSSEFPNIYHIVSTSLENIIRYLDKPDFRINKHFGQIYYSANCSFFEELPKSITRDDLKAAIQTAAQLKKSSSASFHVQLNPKTRNACIVALNAVSKWSTSSYIILNGKSVSKKDQLSCRVVVHPVPSTISDNEIVNHREFNRKASLIKRTGDRCILEISDKNVYDECITRGVIRIDEHRLSVDHYNASTNLDGHDIDNETWYGSEMLKYKPDIMQFLHESNHDIFRMKWNAKSWIEEFEKATPNKFSPDFPKDPREQRGTDIDKLRHQLQMTVMLNTLSSIAKKRYFYKDQELPLNINKDMKTIVFNHASKLIKGFKTPIKPPPYEKTTIRVHNDDCVVVYEKLLKTGKKPLLLNMASAVTPGGGYRKGDGAQEENLFRRSDYYRSLDVGLDDVKLLPPPSARFRCTNKGQLEPLPEPHRMYPMEEYAAIYTSGLTIFRRSQDVGYEYMPKPLENVAAIAMAAYRDPKLDKDELAPKVAIGTRKKIENIFAIAHHQQHDSIVLSAFGCGAFRNPPKHVAQIFMSVIEQYAGYFDTIVFAIIDDHNAGQRLNPHGNYRPFVDVLDGRTVMPAKKMDKANTMYGSFRISHDGSTVNDVCILENSPCHYGAKCSDIRNDPHASQYAHPPLCTRVATDGKCDLKDNSIHMLSFVHPSQCREGGECSKLNDKKHCQDFEHPLNCPQGGDCDDMDSVHLKLYCHVPLCPRGIKCIDFQKHDSKHCKENRHCQLPCTYGNNCVEFHNNEHLKDKKHPFTTPCPFTPFHCPFYTKLSEAADAKAINDETVHQHCLQYSHVCRFGRFCTVNVSLHQEKSIHIIRRICPYDGKCKKLNQEEHLNSYSHKGLADIRRVCQYAHRCSDIEKLDHITKFSHGRSKEDIGVVHLYSLNLGINFARNLYESNKRVLDYIGKQGWKSLPGDTIPIDILNYFRTVQPVHRCSPFVFESILLHGHAMSRDYMENLKKLKFVVTSVMQHARVRRIDNIRIPEYAKLVKEYITDIVSEIFAKANFPPPDPVDPAAPAPPPPPPKLLDPAEYAKNIKRAEKTLTGTFSTNDLGIMKNKAFEIAKASIELHTNMTGIGFETDKVFGTHKRVFAILGPHLGHYYGDVFVVFKREILHHPDADFSMCAATTFGKSGNAYKWRQWLTDPGTADGRVKHYHNTKYHASIPGFEYGIALELMALTSLERNLKSMDMDLQTIFQRWLAIDSHHTIEAHLPQLIPIDYIDHIYVAQNIYDSFKDQTRQTLNAVFKNRYTILKHQGLVSGDPFGPAGPKPQDQGRLDYQTAVINALMVKYKRDIAHVPSRPIQGAVITIPPSGFKELAGIPLTISQAYELYQSIHNKKPSENIAYIYWQTINGDMMLILSKEQMEVNDNQPNDQCLLCYISPKTDLHDDNYHEQTTYINKGQPIQHHKFLTKKVFKAKSNHFHIGSNTDDYITYCLELDRSKGSVTLYQAGANAIYNYQKITCDFTKHELDLSVLEHIYVTADTKEVSVRNLFVTFEKQLDLHPTIDKSHKPPAPAPAPAPAGPGSGSGGGYHGHGSGSGADYHGHSSGASSSPRYVCRDDVNCLLQYMTDAAGKAHITKYSHPCRFSELCRNKDKEPHLTHEPHNVEKCKNDGHCKELGDPLHRAKYRHKDLADFLVPCRDSKCSNKSSDHLTKYSHGEKVYKQKSGGAAAAGSGKTLPRCKWGNMCKDISNGKHRAEFSHHTSDD